MVCWACGVDASRLRLLEAENEALRARLALLESNTSTPEPPLFESLSEAYSSASSSPRATPELQHFRAVRGYTDAGLAEAEAAEESQRGEMDVKVADVPRRCNSCRWPSSSTGC